MCLGILKDKMVVGNLLFSDFMFPRGALSTSAAPLPTHCSTWWIWKRGKDWKLSLASSLMSCSHLPGHCLALSSHVSLASNDRPGGKLPNSKCSTTKLAFWSPSAWPQHSKQLQLKGEKCNLLFPLNLSAVAKSTKLHGKVMFIAPLHANLPHSWPWILSSFLTEGPVSSCLRPIPLLCLGS